MGENLRWICGGIVMLEKFMNKSSMRVVETADVFTFTWCLISRCLRVNLFLPSRASRFPDGK